MEKNNLNEHYSKFQDVPLSEIKEYFTENIFNVLIKYIQSLGDLFYRTKTNELQAEILASDIANRREICSIIEGTVNVLKCKYLNISPNINEDDSVEMLVNKLGLSFKDKRALYNYCVDFNDLIITYISKNYSSLFKSYHNSMEHMFVLLNKVKVVYEFNHKEKEEELDFSKFDNTPLNEVKDFFTNTEFKHLMEYYHILTLGDLFRKADNGELYLDVCKRKMSNRERIMFCSLIEGTLNLLQCKYFNVDPLIDSDTSIETDYKKLGIGFFDARILKCLEITKLSQLLEMVKKNDFHKLYTYSHWRRERIEIIINKAKLIYNYLDRNEKLDFSKKVIKEEREENLLKKEESVSLNEIITLSNKLKKLIEENREIDEQILSTQCLIDEKLRELNINKIYKK